MSTVEGSITGWIARLEQADPLAADRLWRHYMEALVGLAATKLGRRRRVADEEDVALSAFDSFCRGARDGKFPRLHDRHDLWRLLAVITARKAADQIQWANRLKRRGEVGESDLAGVEAAVEGTALEQVMGREPTPEFAAQVAEECQILFDRLGTGTLRDVALWKMEGYDNGEIARKLGCARRTVERKLEVIRGLWEDVAPS
jgi:DNA-directed RNA polymerase specialized sigma24 family protein